MGGVGWWRSNSQSKKALFAILKLQCLLGVLCAHGFDNILSFSHVLACYFLLSLSSCSIIHIFEIIIYKKFYYSDSKDFILELFCIYKYISSYYLCICII